LLYESIWVKMRVVNRGWKIGNKGRNLHCYNVIKDGDCETTPIHWVKVDEWKKVLEDVSLFFLCRVLSWI
jgi:hypothetical protein